jgi:hypothetical protein
MSSRFALASALVKKKHAHAAQYLQESLSEQEIKALEDFRQSRYDCAPHFAPSAASAEEAAILDDSSSGRLELTKLDGRFRSSVVARLEPVLGKPVRAVGSKIEYVASIESWTISTLIDFGGSLPLRYVHNVTSKSDSEFLERVSFLRWLGVSSQTHWDWVLANQVAIIVDCIANLCSRFMNARATLFEESNRKSGKSGIG